MVTYSGYAPLPHRKLVTMAAARARCPLDSPTRPQPCLCTLERTCSCGFPTSEIRAARDRDASLMHTNAHVRASVPSTTRTSQRLAQRCCAWMLRRFGEGPVCLLRAATGQRLSKRKLAGSRLSGRDSPTDLPPAEGAQSVIREMRRVKASLKRGRIRRNGPRDAGPPTWSAMMTASGLADSMTGVS